MQLFSKLVEDILDVHRLEKIQSPDPKYYPKLTVFIDYNFFNDLMTELKHFNDIINYEINVNEKENTIMGYKFYQVLDFNQPYKIVVD